MKGLLVVVEGIGGSGKGTLLDKVEQWCKDSRIEYVRTLTLGGTFEADFLRELCRKGIPNSSTELSPMAQALLFNAARAENLDKVILPALRAGRVVLCDRFLDSTLAYQGSEKGIDPSVLREIHNHAHDDLLPDVTFLLDGNPEIFQKRIHPEEFENDKFDRLEMDRQHRVRDLYLESAKWQWGSKTYHVIDAEVNADQVFAQVLPYLMNLHNQLKRRPMGEFVDMSPVWEGTVTRQDAGITS